MGVLGYHSNTYTGHRLVGKPDEDGLPVATCMSNDTILFLCIILRSTTLFMNETSVFCPS